MESWTSTNVVAIGKVIIVEFAIRIDIPHVTRVIGRTTNSKQLGTSFSIAPYYLYIINNIIIKYLCALRHTDQIGAVFSKN